MSAPSSDANLYSRAGIDDVGEFYRDKFVSNAVLDHRYFKALDRFDLRFARTMWVYDNVRANSALLDLGGREQPARTPDREEHHGRNRREHRRKPRPERAQRTGWAPARRARTVRARYR